MIIFFTHFWGMTEIRKEASEHLMFMYVPGLFKKPQTTLLEKGCLLIKEGW